MARIRTIKPEFWDDEVLARLPFGTRLLYIGLWNHADDEGRMRANPSFVRAKVFPYDELDVAPMLAALEQTGHIQLYTADGQQYLWVRNLTRHQRIDKPSPSVLPEPPDASKNGTGTLPDYSANVPGTVLPGEERSGEERSRSSLSDGERPIIPNAADEFDREWHCVCVTAALNADWEAFGLDWRSKHPEMPDDPNYLFGVVKNTIEKLKKKAPGGTLPPPPARNTSGFAATTTADIERIRAQKAQDRAREAEMRR